MADFEGLLGNVVTNPRFLYSAFSRYDNYYIYDYFESLGLRLKTERGQRVFPASGKSSDVIKVLTNRLTELGVRVLLNTRTTSLHAKDGRITGISYTDNEQKSGDACLVPCDKVIVATGGLSYPATGSTGDGYRLADTLGHHITECVPGLVPIVTSEDYIPRLQGLSLRNVRLIVKLSGKTVYNELGEMLFTHFGVSGPLVLSLSSLLIQDRLQEYECRIDLKPGLDEKKLDNRLIREFDEQKNVQIKNGLSKLLPAKIIPVIIELSHISPEKRINEITREERKSLVNIIKAFPFSISAMRGFDEAIITRGGVKVGEINPKTMESKLVKGLYFAGEVIDTDALTGGFNLQIAWSTGCVTGESV